MTKKQIEDKFTDRLAQIWREVQAELANNGIAIGRVVYSKYRDGQFKITRMRPKFYPHQGGVSFQVNIEGVKLLASGEFGTHEHSVIIE